jgi:hypothetical protein
MAQSWHSHSEKKQITCMRRVVRLMKGVTTFDNVPANTIFTPRCDCHYQFGSGKKYLLSTTDTQRCFPNVQLNISVQHSYALYEFAEFLLSNTSKSSRYLPMEIDRHYVDKISRNMEADLLGDGEKKSSQLYKEAVRSGKGWHVHEFISNGFYCNWWHFDLLSHDFHNV